MPKHLEKVLTPLARRAFFILVSAFFGFASVRFGLFHARAILEGTSLQGAVKAVDRYCIVVSAD